MSRERKWGLAVFLPRNVELSAVEASVREAVAQGHLPRECGVAEVEEAWVSEGFLDFSMCRVDSGDGARDNIVIPLFLQVNGKLIAVTVYLGTISATYDKNLC